MQWTYLGKQIDELPEDIKIMNVSNALYMLKNLDSTSKSKVLTSKIGTKNRYYYKIINIFKTNNIPFSEDSIIETKWRIYNQDFSKKVCKGCKKDVKFATLYKGFPQYCSKSCSSIHRDKSTIKGWMTNEGKKIRKETMLNRYGVEHQLHIPEVFEKQQIKRYKTYSIISPSNKEYKVQGYERFVIPFLWKNYNEDDIVVQKKNLPKINYFDGLKIRKYYPDFGIISENVICEIKSIYTIRSKNLINKLEACLLLGYTPKVYLYHKGVISILSLEDVKNYLDKL